MTRICVSGLGAVSPAGWGVPQLRTVLDRGAPLPGTPVVGPGRNDRLFVSEVPRASPPPAFLAHPRLRRASAITHYAAGAVLEALETTGATTASAGRLGLVMCMLSGCVQYTQRFLREVLEDPRTASPLLFPETVFNAPASHLAALLGKPLVTYTLLGDPATFVQGLGIAAEWLQEGRVGHCLVVGAEETNWLLADALWHFGRGVQLAGGAGAVLLGVASESSLGVELSQVTHPEPYSTRQNRLQAARRVRADLPDGAVDELLCDSRLGLARADAPETAAWHDWPGARMSPKAILGEGLMASSAWQCVAACDALARRQYRAACVSVVGPNQQAIGARFVCAAGDEP